MKAKQTENLNLFDIKLHFQNLFSYIVSIFVGYQDLGIKLNSKQDYSSEFPT